MSFADIFQVCRDRGAGGGGLGGLQPPPPPPPNNFGKIFFSIAKLLFYCCPTAPGRFEVATGTPLFPVTPEQVYRRIYFEALDLIVSPIEERLISLVSKHIPVWSLF